MYIYYSPRYRQMPNVTYDSIDLLVNFSIRRVSTCVHGGKRQIKMRGTVKNGCKCGAQEDTMSFGNPGGSFFTIADK